MGQLLTVGKENKVVMNIENHDWNEVLEAAVTKSKIFMFNRRPVTDKREEGNIE